MDRSTLSLYTTACILAASHHDGQYRKNSTGLAYVTHPLSVSNVLIECGVTDTNAIIAAVLHDILEDTNCSERELIEAVGEDIVNIVKEVTNIESDNKVLVKKAQIIKSKSMSDSAKLVKLADKIDNLSDLSRDPPKGWTKKRIDGYFTWSYAVSKNLFGVNPCLDDKAKSIFRDRKLLDISDEELEVKLDEYCLTL